MKEIERIFVYGKLPFIVLLEDSLGEKLNTLPEKAIEIVSPDDEFKCALFFKKNIKGAVAVEDIYGELTFSNFCIAFLSENSRKKSLNQYFYDKNTNFDFDLLIDVSTEIINKFITIYKSTYAKNKDSKDWIPIITRNRLSPWKIVIPGYENNKTYELVIDYRGTGIGIGLNMPQEQEIGLRKLCMSHFDIDTASLFLQESNRYRQTGDYTSACVFLCSYVEKWVFREVKYKLQEVGKKESEIESFFKNEDGKWIYHEDAVKIITSNKNFINSSEYKNYRDNVIEKRNEIIHRNFVKITKQESEEMVNIAIKYRDYLQEIIWKS